MFNFKFWCICHGFSGANYTLERIRFIFPLFAVTSFFHALTRRRKFVFAAFMTTGFAYLIAIRWVAPVPTKWTCFVIFPISFIAHVLLRCKMRSNLTFECDCSAAPQLHVRHKLSVVKYYLITQSLCPTRRSRGTPLARRPLTLR